MPVLRVAILGQGRSGRDIHGAYLSKDTERFRIVAVVDELEERRARARSEYGCETFAHPDELLARTDLDLVVNASFSKFHTPLTLQFLEAGHNVLCEKPLANRAADVDRMIAAAAKRGKTLAIFQQSRYAPYFQQVRRVIESGVLGEIVQINVAFNGFSRRYDWQTLTSEMGGNLLNTGPHPLDQALQLFGTDRMPQVNCFMRRATTYGDAEDHVLLLLSGEGRPIIHLEISSCCKYSGPTYNVYGTRGGLKSDTKTVEWQYYNTETARSLALTTTPIAKEDGTPAYCSDALEWIREEWTTPPGDGLFNTMSRAFYSMLHAHLTAGGPLEITPQQVRQQIAVIEECQRQNPHIYPDAAG
ncbi:MAG: Gfo/Idh/MocA family oxidoreductase [Armatimonadetes bacterium]|nr:Gfo/Idh/MocA family oxidoreductase [Armatimonadota bacterium]